MNGHTRIISLSSVVALVGLLPGLALAAGATLPATGLPSEAAVSGTISQPNSSDPSLYAPQSVLDGTKEVLTLQWQHRLGEEHSLTLSAGYGEDAYLEERSYSPVSTMASLSWSGQWTGKWQPSLTGTLFAGDESRPDDEAYKQLQRKYVGVAVGGRFRLFEGHTPFVSIRMLRSEYDAGELIDPLASPAEISRLTAGWDWQITRNWRLRAEADYTAADTTLSLYRFDRSRIFFSTRFDFR